jgi:uroporphyrinogen-III decarboxylase
MNQFESNHGLNEAMDELRQSVAQWPVTPKKIIKAYRNGRGINGSPIYLVSHAYAAKLLGVTTNELFTDLSLYTTAQIELTKQLGCDYIYNAIDIFDFEAEALGARLLFPEYNSNPSLTNLPLAEQKDFNRLARIDLLSQSRLPALLAMKAYLHKNLGDLFDFEATGSSPFSLACHLRGYEAFLMDLAADPDYARELLDFCVNTCRTNLSAQLDLGLESVHIADAWAAFPMVNRKIYDEFIFPAVSRLFNDLAIPHKTWTGLYGLKMVPDWEEHLSRLIQCGATELCIYQEDLKTISLKTLSQLAGQHGVSIKLGLFGTCLTPYHHKEVRELMERWTGDLNGLSLAWHVSNIPWDAKLQNIQHLVRQMREISQLRPAQPPS